MLALPSGSEALQRPLRGSPVTAEWLTVLQAAHGVTVRERPGGQSRSRPPHGASGRAPSRCLCVHVHTSQSGSRRGRCFLPSRGDAGTTTGRGLASALRRRSCGRGSLGAVLRLHRLHLHDSHLARRFGSSVSGILAVSGEPVTVPLWSPLNCWHCLVNRTSGGTADPRRRNRALWSVVRT